MLGLLFNFVILHISPFLAQECINFKDAMNFTEMSLSTGLTSLLSSVCVTGWLSVRYGGSYK